MSYAPRAPRPEKPDAERPGAARERKKPRKISPRYLENSALHYLKRYASTTTQIKRVMTRKITRSIAVHGGDRAEALTWLEALIEKLVRNGLINDQSYAETRANSLRHAGRSARVIEQKLRLKGVPSSLATQKIREATEQVSEAAAALIWARKKRLGPFSRDAAARKERRQKDLAALARAGFSFAVARSVIDGDGEPRGE